MGEKEFILTQEGYDNLEKELERLKTVERYEIAERIKVALGFGDLSENSEYDEAKNAQAANENKIADLENKIRHARIIDESEIDTKTVQIGNIVKIKDLEFDEDLEYTIMVNFPDEVNCAINETDFQQPVVVKEGDEEKLVVTKPISKDSTIFAKIDGEYNNRDSAKIYVKAIDDETIFENGKYIDIEVTAYTTKPYRKSIKSTPY